MAIINKKQAIIIIILLLAVIVLAAAPVFQSVTISNSNQSIIQDTHGYCEFTDTDGDDLYYKATWYYEGEESRGYELGLDPLKALQLNLSAAFDSSATIFEMNGEEYIIAAGKEGPSGYVWGGYKKTGDSWESNSTIINGISTLDGINFPTIDAFEMNGEYYAIATGFTSYWGYVWNGTSWESNSTIINGFSSMNIENTFIDVFNVSNNYYLLTSNYLGIKGYEWNGTGWTPNTAYDLPENTYYNDYDESSAGVFRIDGQLYLGVGVKYAPGTTTGAVLGHIWDGYGWNYYPAIIGYMGEGVHRRLGPAVGFTFDAITRSDGTVTAIMGGDIGVLAFGDFYPSKFERIEDVFPSYDFVASNIELLNYNGGLHAIFYSSYNNSVESHSWNGTKFIQDDSMINGLSSYTSRHDSFTTFNDSGTLYGLFMDQASNSVITGKVWNGTGWETNTTVDSGLPDTIDYGMMGKALIDSDIVVFLTNHSGSLAEYTDTSAYVWNGSGWNVNSTYIKGLNIINFTQVNYIDSLKEVSLIGYEADGENYLIVNGLLYHGSSSYLETIGYKWNGTQWVFDQSEAANNLIMNKERMGVAKFAGYDVILDRQEGLNYQKRGFDPRVQTEDVNVLISTLEYGESIIGNWSIGCEATDLTTYTSQTNSSSLYLGYPDWVCTSYAGCGIDDNNECLAVIDNRTNVTYTGSLSDFDMTCNYCSADVSGPFNTSISSCSANEQSYTTYYIDANINTCCAITGLASDCLVDGYTYQETANSIGYNVSHWDGNILNSDDGSWSTFTNINTTLWNEQGQTLNTTIYFNFTTPSRVVGALWQVDGGKVSINATNHTINSSCLDNPITQLAFEEYYYFSVDTNYSNSYLKCYNGSNWINIASATSIANIRAFVEGAVWWDVNGTTYNDIEHINNCNDATITIIEPSNGSTICRQKKILLNVTTSDPDGIDDCWYNTGGANTTTTCNNPINISTAGGWITLTYYVNDSFGKVYSNQTTFFTNIDSDDPIISINNPSNGSTITKNFTTSTFTVDFSASDCLIDSCWYNYWNSTGFPGPNTVIACNEDFNLTVDFFGTHTLLITANDTEGNLGTDQITFNIQQPSSDELGGGGGSQPIKTDVNIPYFVSETPLEQTCGYDGNQDGLACDPNEDWISCPEDCTAPSLDSLLCLSGADCVWREAWFMKILFGILLIATTYVLYLDFAKIGKKPFRKIR